MEIASGQSTRQSYLRSIQIKRLWGYRDIKVQFRPDVNILVGRNGSGKTTVLNIIADILLLDFDALAKIPFESIRLVFRDEAAKRSPYLLVTRLKSATENVDRGLEIRAYNDIKLKKAVAEQVLSYQYKTAPSRRGGLSGILGLATQTLEPLQPPLAAFINNLAAVTWISVHRKLATPSNQLQAAFDSAVDERLEQINIRFTEFVNSIDSEQAQQTASFQKQLLTSLMLTLPSPDLTPKKLSKINITRLRGTIERVLNDLELTAQEEKVADVFDRAAASLARIKSNEGVELNDLLIASYLLQMEKIAGSWSEYSRGVIALHRKKYAISATLDEFFDDKESFISSTGRIYFFRGEDYDNVITPDKLSSGEKQLYILLMETLLAAGKPSIFIADEPELSLHVLWQEKLIDAMRGLNSDAQLLFATHSPDLVGGFSDSVQDMDVQSEEASVEAR
ncbi:AAA family ATPase [Microvirga arsenatis]|uniref:AAA family ATPase n=1 Tax=Microvirga arsenatis TaxID=2692265 RepID=A0ABW9Z0K4_9HYPH|nr:AAA family ATPase [Microvirga arsenatis]NBJ12575.1 AAA family ATPase [Microvirga arsenatis]NBJ26187.1 AAA family ATPase [Microvirga arsenatis]